MNNIYIIDEYNNEEYTYYYKNNNTILIKTNECNNNQCNCIEYYTRYNVPSDTFTCNNIEYRQIDYSYIRSNNQIGSIITICIAILFLIGIGVLMKCH